jgi:hypothetical protein
MSSLRRRARLTGVALTSAALALTALVAVPSSAYAALDSTDPVLVSASRTTPGTVGGDATVGVQVHVTDAGGSHLSVVRVVYQSAAGRRFDAIAQYSGQARDDVTAVVSATTSHWLANGGYEVQRIEVSDGDGNSVAYNRDGSITRGITDVGSHALMLSALDVVVSNPASDASAPRLTSAGLRSSTVKAGDPVLLTYAATDVGSGVEDVQAVYYSPDSAQPVRLISTIESGYGYAGLASGVVPAALEGGSYTLSYVLVRDRAGNGTYYEPGAPDTVRTEPTGLTQPPALPLAGLALTVSQPAGPDVTAPHLTAFSLLSSQRRLGEFATFSFTVSDSSPVTDLRVFLDDPDGRHVVAHKRCGPFAPGRVSFWFPPDVATGAWTVTGVGVVDAAGNIRTYAPSGVGEQSGQPPHTGPVLTGMHVDVTTGAIRPDPDKVDDSCAEPTITSRSSSTYVRTGSSVGVSGSVTWSGVAVARPWVAVLAGQGASARLVAVTTGSVGGAYSARVAVPASTVLRAYFLGSGSVGAPEAFAAPVRVWAGRAAAVTARDTSIRVPRGVKRTLSAYVTPKRGGVVVTLWRKKGGVWRTVTATRSTAAGKVSHRVGRPARKALYRWSTGYAGGFLPAVSRTITVRR